MGYTVDVAGAVALSECVSLGACLRNAIGAITWKDTLFVEGIVNTDTVTVDENGYLVCPNYDRGSAHRRIGGRFSQERSGGSGCRACGHASMAVCAMMASDCCRLPGLRST